MENKSYDFENLNIGSSGIMVYILQKNLNHIGENLKEDGVFGKETESAIKKFQLEHNLKSNGIVDYKIMIEIDIEYERQYKKAI